MSSRRPALWRGSPGVVASRRSVRLVHACFMLLIVISLAGLIWNSPVRAMTHNRPPSPASIHALQQALKKQIHVTHTGTPLRSATTPGKTLLRPLSPSLPAYNNIGISDKATRAGASFDQLNHSYAASVLQDAGLVPGMAITSQSVTFIWPSVPTGQADNYQAAGQVIPVSALPGAATVGFLGASSGGATSGTATLTYTDNSTQTFTLGFTDWWSGSPQFSNQQVAHMTTINTKHGTKSGNFYLYSVTAALNTSKTLQSVTLPTTVSPGQLHVFAVGVGGPAFNNAGVSDDSNPGLGSYDGANDSYSAQALASADLAPNQLFDSDGIAYSWPGVAAGTMDNYQASGLVIPVLPVPNATMLGFLGSATQGNSSGTATMTFTDSSTQTFTLGFTDWATTPAAFGNTVAATMSYRNTLSGKQTITVYLFTTEVAIPAGKTLLSVTLPLNVSGGQLHVFAVGTRSTLNNLATSNDSQPGGGDMDNGHSGYSIQAMEAAGMIPGQPFSFDGCSFTIPASYGALADNNLVNGQVLPVTAVPNATTLIVLGAAAYNNESGTATITYSDGSTQSFTLSLSDWLLGNNTQSPAFGNGTVITTSYLNTPSGRDNLKAYIFSTEIALQPAKTVQSVTLPTTLSPSNGLMHVFAVGTRSAYNNTGISDNSNPTGANFDGAGASYSAQDFADPSIAGWNPGDTLTYQGINYIWPGVPAGQADNYLAAGQVIPVTAPAGATTIGFVGAADFAFPSSSGTATLTYTDGSTSTFTLGMTDWAMDSGTAIPMAGNRLFAILPHFNDAQGTHTSNLFLFEMETPLNAAKQLQSVTLPSSVNQGHLHIFMLGMRTGENFTNNVGTSDDSDTVFANYDGQGNSYSVQALEAFGLNEGQPFTTNGVTFTWPASFSVIPDNYQAAGQTIPVSPVAGATTLAFLGSATGGSSSGTATITYTDTTTQTFTLSFGDWAGGTQGNNLIAAACSYRNTPGGEQSITANLFYTDVVLAAGKIVQSVTLPSSVSGGQLHVFAVGTKASSTFTSSSVRLTSWRNANGTQETFARGTDNNIWYNYQVIANGGWSGWAPLQSGMQFNGDPTAALIGNGVLQVFARGSDNNIWTNWETAPNSLTWNGWVPLQTGFTFQGTPTIAYMGNGTLDVFARGTDNNIWHNPEQSIGGWSGWATIQAGKQFNGDPTAGRIGSNGVIQVFALGTDNNIWTAFQTAPNSTTWSAWGPHETGFSFQGTPAIVVVVEVGVEFGNHIDYNDDGRMTVIAQGSDNNIWATWETCLNCGWTTWAPLQSGKQFNGDVGGGKIQISNGVEQIFARGTDNNIWTTFQTSGNSSTWNAWGPQQTGLSVTFQGTPAIDYTADGRMQVYVVGSDSHIWTTWETSLSGPWTPWTML